MRLEDMKTTEVAALSPDTVVIVPIASIEQHGPHLPVGTDSMLNQGIIDRLDAACNDQLLLLPVLKYGCSEHHMAFSGTVTLSHETFKTAVLEMLDSMIRHGFRRFVVLNSHGGNMAIGGVIAENASFRWPDAQVVVGTWFRIASGALKGLVEGEFPSAGHAAEIETSMMMVLHPDLVDMSKAVDDGNPPTAPQLQGDLLSGASAALSTPFHRLTNDGVYGKATLASHEKGEKLLAATTGALKQLIVDVWPDAL